MWVPPTNIYNFILQSYRLTLECGEITISIVINKTEYHHEGRIGLGLCIATVEVINSCGATSSNSISFIHTRG